MSSHYPPRLIFSTFCLLFFFLPVAWAHQRVPDQSLPAVGTIAPDFTLTDANTGKNRTLSKFANSKRPVTLFFFCGCPACHAVAVEWAKSQRANLLPAGTATVIVYSTTDRTEARERVLSAGLDPKQTAILCDTDVLSVTERLYHAQPCPRILVLDRTGTIRYANTGDDESPQTAPAQLLVARAVAALIPYVP